MNNERGIDICSSVTVFIETWVFQQKLSNATAFLWVAGQRKFLVTNWHVLAGRNPETNQPLHSSAGISDRIVVHFQNVDADKPPIVRDFPLIVGDDRTWLEHPVAGRKFDIAAIEVEFPPMEESNYFPLNAVPQMQIKQRVGMPVFIIGFPFGLQKYGVPIWKMGSFASEPFLSEILDTHLVIDSASRPGMSGSPVIKGEYGEIELDNGHYGRTQSNGGCRIVGVYSGRFHTNDQSDAQLGRVWPIRLVRQMLDDEQSTLNEFLAK